METIFPTKVHLSTVTLRTWTDDDIEPFRHLLSNEEVNKYFSLRGQVLSTEKAQKLLEYHRDHWLKRGFGLWAITDTQTQDLIGFGGLRWLEQLSETELLYALAPSHWRRGIATAVAKEAVRLGFTEGGLKRIVALTDPANLRSHRVLERIGFRCENRMNFGGHESLYYARCSGTA